jgi:hypothetical protein
VESLRTGSTIEQMTASYNFMEHVQYHNCQLLYLQDLLHICAIYLAQSLEIDHRLTRRGSVGSSMMKFSQNTMQLIRVRLMC